MTLDITRIEGQGERSSFLSLLERINIQRRKKSIVLYMLQYPKITQSKYVIPISFITLKISLTVYF